MMIYLWLLVSVLMWQEGWSIQCPCNHRWNYQLEQLKEYGPENNKAALGVVSCTADPDDDNMGICYLTKEMCNADENCKKTVTEPHANAVPVCTRYTDPNGNLNMGCGWGSHTYENDKGAQCQKLSCAMFSRMICENKPCFSCSSGEEFEGYNCFNDNCNNAERGDMC